MCGFVGTYSNSVNYGREMRSVISAMNKVIEHRGPDDDGIYISEKCCLGFQRLSIIDIESGHQPMQSDDKRFTIVLNGEIYNYKDLKSKLHDYKFFTNSDTEVLLNGYRKWGAKVLDRISGIFAFAIYDNKKNSIFLARDHVGVKPLYYTNFNNNFLFASEIKSILEFPNFKPSINIDKIPQYLNFLWTCPPETLFKDISMLEPGHYLLIENNQINITKYWEPNLNQEKNTLSLQQNIDFIDNELDRIIKEQMVADVPVGSFLSGGLDSTAIVYKMKGMTDKKVKTYTTGFNTEDIKNDVIGSDLYYARQMSKKLDIDYNEIILSPDIVDILPKIIYHLEEPLPDPAAITSYLICQEASKDLKVLLSGVGADEIFGGYPRYLANKVSKQYNIIPKFLRRSIIEPMLNSIPSSRNSKARNIKKLIKYNDSTFIKRYLGFSGYYSSKELNKIINSNFSYDNIFKTHLDCYNSYKTDSELTSMMNIDLKTFLPNLNLMYTDKMSSAHSVEVRVPFLDHQLIESVNAIPDNFKLHGYTRKYILKKVFQKYLPSDVVWRKKVGFSAPIGSWINNECKTMVTDLLSKDRVNSRGYFNYDYINQMLNDQFSGKEYNANQIWQLLCFELWCQEFID